MMQAICHLRHWLLGWLSPAYCPQVISALGRPQMRIRRMLNRSVHI